MTSVDDYRIISQSSQLRNKQYTNGAPSINTMCHRYDEALEVLSHSDGSIQLSKGMERRHRVQGQGLQSSSDKNNNNDNLIDANSTSGGVDVPVSSPSVPLSPQRVQLLAMLYERTDRARTAEDLWVRAIEEGISTHSDVGKR